MGINSNLDLPYSASVEDFYFLVGFVDFGYSVDSYRRSS